MNHALDKHYKKCYVLPGGFIPGPNKPKNIDSFLFPGLHHLAALQNERLCIWDASRDVTFLSDLYLLFATADGPGLVAIKILSRRSTLPSASGLKWTMTHLHSPLNLRLLIVEKRPGWSLKMVIH